MNNLHSLCKGLHASHVWEQKMSNYCLVLNLVFINKALKTNDTVSYRLNKYSSKPTELSQTSFRNLFLQHVIQHFVASKQHQLTHRWLFWWNIWGFFVFIVLHYYIKASKSDRLHWLLHYICLHIKLSVRFNLASYGSLYGRLCGPQTKKGWEVEIILSCKRDVFAKLFHLFLLSNTYEEYQQRQMPSTCWQKKKKKA